MNLHITWAEAMGVANYLAAVLREKRHVHRTRCGCWDSTPVSIWNEAQR